MILLTDQGAVSSSSIGMALPFLVVTILIAVAVVIFLLIKKSAKEPAENIRLCPQCGKPVKNGKNFCTSCGAKIE